MNVVIFIHSLGAGGAERVASGLANHWASIGWQVSLVTVESEAQDCFTLHSAVHRHTLNLAGASGGILKAATQNIRRVLALRTMLKRLQPNIALALMTEANIILALASLGLKEIRTVGSERVHPPRVPLSLVWDASRRRLYSQLDAIVALTQESADWLRNNTRSRFITVIPNAATWPLSISSPYLAVPEKLSSKHRRLLAVGRLCDQKGFDLLIECFRSLVLVHPNWRLDIVGEGPCRAHLLEQIHSSGMRDCVSLLGHAGNVAQWYGNADLYVMSSRFEGFPNTLVEAMSHGLPVVSFDCETGPRDIIRHEVDGMLVPDGDTEALKAALHSLMGNEPLRLQYGARAMEVRERFSLQKISGMWEALFYEIRHGQ